MDLPAIEEIIRKTVEAMDKGARLEAVLEEEDEYRVILSKGSHSDRAVLSRKVMQGFVETGAGGQEMKKILGKVISKLNRMGLKRN